MAKMLESPVVQLTIPSGTSVNAVITDDRSGKKIGKTVNTSIPTMNTEVSYVIPSTARGFSAKLILGILSIRFNLTDDYKIVSAGNTYDIEKISPDAGTITLYVKSSKDSDTLQVESWS